MNRPFPTSSSSTTSTLSAQPTRRKSRSPNTSANSSGNGLAGLPAKHPSRLGTAASINSNSRTPQNVSMSRSSSGSSSGWGVQWSTLQGLASSVLGNDALGSDSEQTVKQRRRAANNAGTGNAHRTSSSSSWLSTVAAADEHTDALGRGNIRPRGRRREDQSQSASSSTRRNYKRATSPDPDSDMDMELERDREGEMDTLAYVHHVKPSDTMEGVAIAFNIHPSALRKANGMWSHDGVQSRKTLLLPVDECRVKGKQIDLLDTDNNGTAMKSDAGTKAAEGQQDQTDSEETPYKHESYVNIEGIGQVEIARLARKKLSHFPPRRRKGDSTRRLTSLDSPDYSAHLSLLDEPPSPTADVFRGMTPGVGELHPQHNQNHNHHNVPPGGLKIGPGPGIALGPETFTMKTLGEIAQDTAAGLENVGSVVEGFVRRWTMKAQGFVGNDLIELTQRLGFEIQEEESQATSGTAGMERSGSRRGGGGGSATSTAGDGGRRVVRERLTRKDGERSKAL